MTALRMRVCIYACWFVWSHHLPEIFKSLHLRKLYVHVQTANAKIYFDHGVLTIFFNDSGSDLLSARERVRLQQEERATARLQCQGERD